MKKKLQLNKETLVRLRDEQLAATHGGAAAVESKVVDRDEELAPSSNSCCRKTCNGRESDEVQID